MTPKVSVLMTAYNRAPYIASSIESVLAQTFGDFELLITDNCSTDATFDIAKQYERLDPRIRVVRNERNLGHFGNRNRAAGLARGSLLKYHDSDDLMYPHCLAVMVPMLMSEPSAGFGLSTGNAWSGGPCPMLLTPRMAYQREFFGEGLFQCGPGGSLFRTEVFHELGGFVDAGAPSDHLFWMRACTKVNVLLMPADLFWYRMHPLQEFQSLTAQLQNATMAGLIWQAIDQLTNILLDWPVDIRRGRWRIAAERLRLSNMAAGDWLKYLRRPRRDPIAGTPLAVDGDFVTPSWVHKA